MKFFFLSLLHAICPLIFACQLIYSARPIVPSCTPSIIKRVRKYCEHRRNSKRSADDAFLCPAVLPFVEKGAPAEKYAIMRFLRSRLPSGTHISAMCMLQSAQGGIRRYVCTFQRRLNSSRGEPS